MNKIQINEVEHALKNGGRFYTDVDDKNWNDLVSKGFATKGGGWDKKSAYFFVTSEGKNFLKGESNCQTN